MGSATPHAVERMLSRALQRGLGGGNALTRRPELEGAVWDTPAWSIVDRVIQHDPAVWVIQPTR